MHNNISFSRRKPQMCCWRDNAFVVAPPWHLPLTGDGPDLPQISHENLASIGAAVAQSPFTRFSRYGLM
jgi:hypothetical protein